MEEEKCGKMVKGGEKEKKKWFCEKGRKENMYQGMYSTSSAMLSVEYILNRQVWALFRVEAIEFEEAQL